MEVEKIDNAILAELKEGGNYFIAIRRGSISEESMSKVCRNLKEKNINLYGVYTYDNPKDCIVFSTAKIEEKTA